MEYYYGVIYMTNGQAYITHALKSEEQTIRVLKNKLKAYPGKIKATTWIISEAESVEELFGHPKSRDLMLDNKSRKEL